MKKTFLAFLALFVVFAVLPARGTAQVILSNAPILIPNWNPGDKYDPAPLDIVGSVQSTYETDGPDSYSETWQWTVSERPPVYAVQGGAVPKDLHVVQRDDAVVLDYFNDGCAAVPEPIEGESWAVYTAVPGEVPEQTGTMIRDPNGGIEHWYLSDGYTYPDDKNAIATIVRRDPDAKVTPDFDRYIRVEMR